GLERGDARQVRRHGRAAGRKARAHPLGALCPRVGGASPFSSKQSTRRVGVGTEPTAGVGCMPAFVKKDGATWTARAAPRGDDTSSHGRGRGGSFVEQRSAKKSAFYGARDPTGD